jgi:hypothetical protein
LVGKGGRGYTTDARGVLNTSIQVEIF